MVNNYQDGKLKLSAVAGVTYEVDQNVLTQITGSSSRVFFSPDFRQLSDNVVDVVAVACGDSIIQPTTTLGKYSSSVTS